MSVVAFDRRPEAAADLVAGMGGRVVAVGGDVGDDDDVAAAIGAAWELGPVSVLVNTAGGGVGGGRTVDDDSVPHDLASFVRTMTLLVGAIVTNPYMNGEVIRLDGGLRLLSGVNEPGDLR